ncbi:MAG: hypothetical protein AABZ07_05235 [Nitrospirota bacterium]
MTLTDERVRNGEYKLQPVATASALYSTYDTMLNRFLNEATIPFQIDFG